MSLNQRTIDVLARSCTANVMSVRRRAAKSMVFAAMFVLLAIVTGCAAPTRVCVPGQTQACACPGGVTGVQTCSADGAQFGACGSCGAPVPCGGACTAGQICVADRCVAQMNCSCAGRTCGDDGCGQSCGTCGASEVCQNGTCARPTCSPACGAGQTCQNGVCVQAMCTPACSTGFRCNAGANTCELVPSSFWDLVVVGATIPQRDCAGDTWDAGGGLPDPRMCITMNGATRCTEEIADTTSPQWTMSRFDGATGAMLQAGVRFALEDVDISANDTMCSGTIAVTDAQFRAGGGTVSCTCANGGAASTFRYQLVAR